MKPFEARYVSYILDKYTSGVFDFGAGYTVYENSEMFSTVKTAFSKYDYVIYLRYSNNKEESLNALNERHEDVPIEVFRALNWRFIISQCNDTLATKVIDTKGKTIKDVVAEVLKVVQHTI